MGLKHTQSLCYTGIMILAVDIGGTKTLIGQFKDGQLIHETRFDTDDNAQNFLNNLLYHLKDINPSQIEAICIAAPGIIGHDGTILRCSNLPWKNFALPNALTQTFRCPIFIENDANLGGLGEAQTLDTIPPLLLYLTISTGIGSGIITHGKINPALANSEAGRMILPTMDGPKAWQDFASGSAIKEHFHHLATDINELEDWEEIAYNLALGLEVLIPILQPNLIILGGSIGAFLDKYILELTSLLQQRLPAYTPIPEIKQAKHPNQAVIYGCYQYAVQQLTRPDH